MSVKEQQPAGPSGCWGRLVGVVRGGLPASRIGRWTIGGALLTVILACPLALLRVQTTLRLRREAQLEHPTLAMALVALEHEAYGDARRIAEQVDRSKLKAADLGGPDYVLGIVAATEADELWGAERKNYYLLAARHLEVARQRQFGPAQGADGSLLFGKSLYYAGRITESRPILEKALEDAPEQATIIHALLTGAYRRRPKRDLEKAVEHNRQYLADQTLSASDREAGQLREAQLLWQLKDYDACATAIEHIPSDAFLRPEVDLLRGQLALRAARELQTKLDEASDAAQRQAVKASYDAAIKILRNAQDDPLGDRAIRRSMYLIGVCLMETGDARGALAQFERTRDVYGDTPEGLAAGLQEADLRRAAGKDEAALAAYRRTLGAVKQKRKFKNQWIPSAQFRTRMLAAYQHYVDKGQFENAISLTERLAPLFPAAQALRLTGETYRNWAHSVLQTAGQQSDAQAGEKQARGRALYRQAGQVFGELAKLEFTTPNYPDDVWQSAESYLAGHQFSEAVASLEEYLKYELRRRRPLALVNMGEALLALGRIDDALFVLGECIEFYPNDAASFVARLWASRAHAEKGDVAAAEGLLRENLNGDLLTPDSKEWRDSLFALGKLLAANGRHVDAVERLEEAVNRYPDSRQAIEARYLIAESCQRAAKVPQQKADTDGVETARLAHIKQAHQFLEMAIDYYEQTQEALNRRQEQSELSPLEKALLRNSYFAVGAALVELGRYEDAIRAYSTATNRYQHDPEVLEAFSQIATCYRRLNKPREARGAVQQAKAVLERIKPDASFAEATIYSRREWTELLEWLGKL